MSDPAREAVVQGAARFHAWSNTGTTIWSALFNGGTLLALTCSTASTFILAINPPEVFHIQTHALTAGVSAVAALAIGIPKYLSAERKWRANRHTRSEVRILQRFLADSVFSTQDARDWLAEIERRHERELMGDGKPFDAPPERHHESGR